MPLPINSKKILSKVVELVPLSLIALSIVIVFTPRPLNKPENINSFASILSLSIPSLSKKLKNVEFVTIKEVEMTLRTALSIL